MAKTTMAPSTPRQFQGRSTSSGRTRQTSTPSSGSSFTPFRKSSAPQSGGVSGVLSEGFMKTGTVETPSAGKTRTVDVDPMFAPFSAGTVQGSIGGGDGKARGDGKTRTIGSGGISFADLSRSGAIEASKANARSVDVTPSFDPFGTLSAGEAGATPGFKLPTSGGRSLPPGTTTAGSRVRVVDGIPTIPTYVPPTRGGHTLPPRTTGAGRDVPGLDRFVPTAGEVPSYQPPTGRGRDPGIETTIPGLGTITGEIPPIFPPRDEIPEITITPPPTPPVEMPPGLEMPPMRTTPPVEMPPGLEMPPLFPPPGTTPPEMPPMFPPVETPPMRTTPPVEMPPGLEMPPLFPPPGTTPPEMPPMFPPVETPPMTTTWLEPPPPMPPMFPPVETPPMPPVVTPDMQPGSGPDAMPPMFPSPDDKMKSMMASTRAADPRTPANAVGCQCWIPPGMSQALPPLFPDSSRYVPPPIFRK